jgi:phage shock protein PspC (stress-responsive transcriptional regulator)
MKKTITINLNGIVFHIEEDGYSKLKTYFDSIREYFNAREGSQEIMNDIEARAAEKFSEKISAAKQAVSLSDVEAFMESMGTVEDIAGEEKPEKEDAPQETWQKKKLYRDSDEAVLMGVAAGLAAYFGIDPVVVRLFFVASLFFGGFGIIVYILLCFIIPEAKTTSQKMEMKGQPINLSNLREAAEEKISLAKEKLSSSNPLRKFLLATGELLKKIVSFIKRFAGKFFSFFFKIIGVGIIIGASGALLVIFLIFSNLAFNLDVSFIDFPGKDFLGGANFYVALSAGFLTVFVPVLFALFVGIFLFSRRFVLGLATSLCMLLIWMIAIATLSVYVVKLIPKYSEKISATDQLKKISQKYDWQDFDSIRVDGNYKVKIVRGEDF